MVFCPLSLDLNSPFQQEYLQNYHFQDVFFFSVKRQREVSHSDEATVMYQLTPDGAVHFKGSRVKD